MKKNIFLDLGAEGGISSIWKSGKIEKLFKDYLIYAVDIDNKNIINEKSDINIRLIKEIIYSENSIKTFYIPVRDSGSSVFEFNKEYSYLHTKNYHTIINEIKVQTYRLDYLIESGKLMPPNVIKLDIQGAELAALKSLGNYLKNVEIIESEFELIPIYEGQPTFPDLHKFIYENKYDLIDMHLSKTYYTNGVKHNYFIEKYSKSRMGINWMPQVYAGDAFQALTIEKVLKLSLEELINHLKLLALYKCFDRVFYIIDICKYKQEILKHNDYKILLKMANDGWIKEIIVVALIKIFRKLKIKMPIGFDRKYSWIERNFPNI